MNRKKTIMNLIKKIQGTIQERSAKAKIIFTILLFELCNAAPVWASSQVVNQINNLYTLVVGIIAAAGAIVLAWGGFELGMAYFERDSSSQVQALRKIIGGLIMLGIGGIIALIKGS